jgi:protein-L-isoaspartate(D-aspartate) O-methyltransferase
VARGGRDVAPLKLRVDIITAVRKHFPIGLDKLAPKPARKSTRAVVVAPTVQATETKLPRHERARSSVPSTATGAAALRQRMVARLAREGIGDARVLDAMSRLPRHAFVDPALEGQAYADVALPIGLGQTISSPSVVARMLTLLFGGAHASRTSSLGRVLEVGTGCGYQAALLSLLGTSVISVERLRALYDLARRNLASVDARRSALRLVLGDGRLGHPPNAPYDSIIVAAVGDAVPPAWIDQLAVGGRLVMPQHVGASQVLVVIDRTEEGTARSEHEAVRFVPLESGVIA